jgi:hypothetical protein
MVVEELLKFLVSKVDAELLEPVQLIATTYILTHISTVGSVGEQVPGFSKTAGQATKGTIVPARPISPARRMNHLCPMYMYLFNKFNAGKKIHAKINKCPFDALPRVFFLLQHKHVMVEELLQLLVGKVDADLLEPVELITTTIKLTHISTTTFSRRTGT